MGPFTAILFWLLFVPAMAVWLGFAFWRAGRLTRAAATKDDWEYDQKSKFLLPPEYADRESVLAASRRRRAKRCSAQKAEPA